jgi:hypothetical protein
MAVAQFNLDTHQRAERKLLLTVAEWKTDDGLQYAVQTERPDDWDTKYNTYYERSGASEPYTYTKVTGETAPTWAASTYYTKVDRELLGRRTEDSSVEYNNDIETSTDILGINYSDLNKTQPQQDFDPYLILGGSRLGAWLNDKRRRNALSEISNFTLYLITAYVGDATNGYAAERHSDCTITYNSLGGDANVNMPISAYFSNNITLGKVDKLGDDFEFTLENDG